MTRKDYIMLAATLYQLRGTLPPDHYAVIVGAFLAQLARAYANFNPAKFERACHRDTAP